MAGNLINSSCNKIFGKLGSKFKCRKRLQKDKNLYGLYRAYLEQTLKALKRFWFCISVRQKKYHFLCFFKVQNQRLFLVFLFVVLL